MNPKPYDRLRIVRGLKTRWIGRSLIIFDDCASTNDVIARMAKQGAPRGVVVITETQHAGRGGFGRVWYSPRGGVWLSILIKPQGSASSVHSLPLIAALAIAKVLVQNFTVTAGVRWPNDVVVGRQKIAGTLMESESKGNELIYAALGIGINANFETREVEAIRDSSTSLLTLTGKPINREEFVVALLTEMEAMYESFQARGESAIMEVLRSLDWSRGRRVSVRTADRRIVGVFDDYMSLDRVQIATRSGPQWVEASTLVSVDYESD